MLEGHDGCSAAKIGSPRACKSVAELKFMLNSQCVLDSRCTSGLINCQTLKP